jgi:hypothetical protein
MPLTSLRPPLADSLPMASWSLTGKLWFTWPALTSRKNKCLGPFGSMQSFTRLG